MAVTVRFVSVFQELTKSKNVFLVEEGTIGEIIDRLNSKIPGLRKKLITSQGTLHPAYQIICTKGSIQQVCPDLDYLVAPGGHLIIIPLISGG